MELITIFLDEVSMISCNDNYKDQLSACKALNEFDLPYGLEFNMIFSGLCSTTTCVWISSLQWLLWATADVTYDCQGQEAAIERPLASNDHSCDTEKEYETKRHKLLKMIN